jgi:hypothetical protein
MFVLCCLCCADTSYLLCRSVFSCADLCCTVPCCPVLLQGYADLAAGLEKVSEAKGAVDEAKGQVLQVRREHCCCCCFVMASMLLLDSG